MRLKLSGGFRPGYLYELVCECEGPIVQGLGFAAVRDLVSFLRYEATPANPLRTAAGKPAVTRAGPFGVSQSGRFLRNYLYLGYNADEAGRKVFDGLVPHVAGGGLGFFSHRFAQPTRFNGQHEDTTTRSTTSRSPTATRPTRSRRGPTASCAAPRPGARSSRRG